MAKSQFQDLTEYFWPDAKRFIWMVYDATLDLALANPVAETLLSVVLLTPGIISKLSWTEAIWNKPGWVIEHFQKN